MATRLELPKYQAFDSNGDPLTGGLLYTYEVGTSTLKATYTDANAGTEQANPIVLNSRGEADSDIYGIGAYKMVLKTSVDVTIFTIPSVTGIYIPETDYYQYPDSDAVDQGVTGDSNTIKYFVDSISTDNGTIVLKHDSGSSTTTYTLTTSESIPSNVKIIIEEGAILDGAGTLTIDNLGQIDAGPNHKIFGSSITVTATNGGTAYAEWWGVDGTADEVQVNLALGCGANEVILKGKTYTCNDEVTVPVNVNLIGVNPETTILDFSSATGTFSNSSCVYAAGDGLTEIGALNSNITKGTNTVSFASSPSANYGDVVIIHDTDDNSYSGFRTYYQAGEYGVVEEVSGNDIELTKGTFSSYTADANTKVFKYDTPTSSKLSGFKVIGLEDESHIAISVIYGNGALIENVDISFEQGLYGLSIQQCFNTRVVNVKSEIHSYISGQTIAYPIGIYNSQSIFVDRCFGVSPWHVITVGGGSGDGKVVNRDIKITNSTFLTNDTSASGLAADIHGNTEHSSITNCYSHGIAPAGNFITVADCDIYMSDKSYAMVIGEPTGLDYSIRNNRFVIDGDPATSRGSMINIGGNESHLTSDTGAGGKLEIVNNTVKYNGTADDSTSLIRIINRGCTQDDMKIFIENNKIEGNYSATGHNYAINIDVVSGAAFNHISINNNYIYGYGIKIEGVLAVNIENNVLLKGGEEGIRVDFGSVVTGTPGIWKITNNSINEFQKTGMWMTGDSGQLITHLFVSDNIVTENSIADTGTSAYDSALYIYRATSAYVNNNVLGGTGAEQEQPAAYYTITTLYDGANIYFGTGSGSEIYDSVTTQNEITYSTV